jgi:hypothetical protein
MSAGSRSVVQSAASAGYVGRPGIESNPLFLSISIVLYSKDAICVKRAPAPVKFVAVSSGVAFAWFAVGGWLLGLCVGLLARPMEVRVIVGMTGLLAFVGSILAGVLFSSNEGAAGAPIFGGVSAAGWLAGVAASLLVRVVDRGYSERSKRKVRQGNSRPSPLAGTPSR